MKNKYFFNGVVLIALMLLYSTNTSAQQTLYSQDFEGVDFDTYQLVNSGGTAVGFLATGSDYIQRAMPATLPLGAAVTGFTGNVIALEDHDGAGFFGAHSINTSAIDIDGASGITVGIKIAAPRGNAGNRYEVEDILQVQVSIDGGAFSTIINTGGSNDDKKFYHDVNNDGITGNVGDIVIATTVTTITVPVSATGSSMVVRVLFDSQGAQEEMLFDDILVQAATVVACSEPDVPTVTFAPPTICDGNSALLTISGSLNDATAWQVYTGSCGGSSVGSTAGSTIIVTPPVGTTTYYVRGEGGCATAGSCGTVTITMTTREDASFSYVASAYCQDATDPSPTITGVGGGSFSSSPAGLSITASTGAIDVSASTPGTYTVTYTSPGLCAGSEDVSVTINALDDASFSYDAAAYCADASDPTPTITGLGGGTFSSSPAGLSLNVGSGAIDVSASTPGTYTVTYTTAGSCPNASNVIVTVNALDDASFSYAAASYCVDASDPMPTITGLTGGSFSSTAGLSISSSGTIDVSVSTPGTYTVTYTTVGTCPNASNVIVTVNALDDASFSYAAASYCADASDPTPTITGLGGGTFSSTAGLTLNAGSGAIDVSTSTPGTYTVTYTTAGSCPNASNVSVTVNALDDASFSYAAASYCADASDPTPTITGLGGGTFSSTAGLTLNIGSGAIDVSTSTPGTYTVTYTTAGSCPNASNVSVTVNDLDDASFSYDASSYSTTDADPTPTITGLAGGTFSSTAGLSISGSTGAIDVSASTPDTYTVTYTTAGSCPNSSSTNITIDVTLSTANQLLAQELQILPNPASDYISIRHKANQQLESLEVYDMLGKLVLTKNLSSVSEHTIALATIPAGIYWFKINAENATAMKRVVVGK